ncbi:MAG TPA: hypothetical protein DDY98_02350 [Ruminococcaceae bacterium]|nr:hypothetical protein [Oscillospiraceae bacterium]
MTDNFKTIQEMKNGNKEIIVDSIVSSSPILVMNAILFGTRDRITDSRFVKGLTRAEDSIDVLFGVPVSSVATASLHLLGQKNYNGEDKQIQAFINSRLGF